MELSGIVLMFMLGLRHGFDPDHIAIIDGISVRLSYSSPRAARWAGTLFAIGHGSVVTFIAVIISGFSQQWNLSADLWHFLDWIPGILLILVGLMNLKMLLRRTAYTPQGLKVFFMPKTLRNSSSPLAIILTGVLFATVFDTNTQVAAWAYTASSNFSILGALVLGLSFSAGLILTATMDSRIMYFLLRRSMDSSAVSDYRRKLGWLIVILSLVMGCYKVTTLLYPALSLDDTVLTAFGIGFFILMAIFYGYLYLTKSLQFNQEEHGH
ncbi:nickel permease [Flavobacterium beibuense]|uniref:Nickel/cobalt efflux system n=1 Tax=Flavobacterium beibuense TaxID=657326 RepID=A0A444WEK7_9FLAO|nr:nickel permease [Flavobacterium beibuense]RYJ44212.1 Nickel permease [Flavobacterium beibuense]